MTLDTQNKVVKSDQRNSVFKGENRYILGKVGSGKTNFILGVIINTLSQNLISDDSKKHSNIVVVDTGRTYEGLTKLLPDSQFVTLTTLNDSELAPVALSNKSLTVFELEELKRFVGDPFTDNVIDLLKSATSKDTLLIIDEWWRLNPKLKQWALTEFDGETLVVIMCKEDITQDHLINLFDGGIELGKPTHKRSVDFIIQALNHEH